MRSSGFITTTHARYPSYLHAGQEEIEATCFALAERLEQMRTSGSAIPELLLLPIYSTLPSELQASAYCYQGKEAGKGEGGLVVMLVGWGRKCCISS